MEINFTDEEAQLLLELLEQQHREVLHEIAHTDHHEFKILLRKREKVLQSILDKVAQGVCV